MGLRLTACWAFRESRRPTRFVIISELRTASCAFLQLVSSVCLVQTCNFTLCAVRGYFPEKLSLQMKYAGCEESKEIDPAMPHSTPPVR